MCRLEKFLPSFYVRIACGGVNLQFCTGAIFNYTVLYLGYMLALTHVLNILTVPLASCNYQAVIILFLNGAEKKRNEQKKHLVLSRESEPVWPSSVQEFPCYRSNVVQNLVLLMHDGKSNPIQSNNPEYHEVLLAVYWDSSKP